MQVVNKAFLAYIFLCNVDLLSAARILAVFPVPSISHQVVFRPITQELAKRGHEVIVITPDPVFPNGATPQNLTEIDVHDISYKIWAETFIKSSKGVKNDMIQQMKVLLDSFISVVDALLSYDKVKEIIQNKKQHFDLIITEACVRSTLIFSYIYKVPVIQMSSLGGVFDNFKVIGASTHPILYPDVTRSKLYNLTLWDKINELYLQYKMEMLLGNTQIAEDTMLKIHYGPNVPSVSELNKNVEMLFLNINPLFEGLRPVPPSVIYMGGLHQKESQELPHDLKSFLDSSTNGVIYISFGTNVDPSLLPADRIATLVNTVSKVPYNILWKWNKDELPGRTKNIRISKWLPQSDLLKHCNVKLFVTQGGLQSTDEAITAGVPLIGIPMLGDQWFNVEKYVHLGIGVRLDMETLTEEIFGTTITTVINNSSYRQNIVRLRTLMNDQPMRPLERAIWWIEHILRHGGAKHLRSPAANITWTEYLELELVLVLLAAVLLVVVVLGIMVRLLYTNIIKKYLIAIKTKCD